MDIDMMVLRSLEREKEISFEVLVEAIEQALLIAQTHVVDAIEALAVLPPCPAGAEDVLADV